jgi:hypothetical protein
MAALVAARADAVTGTPIAAACYEVRGRCRVHVEPFTLTPAPGARLESFTIRFGSSPLYEFRTDVGNPPAAPYLSDLPRRDFAARCETSQTVSVTAKDSADVSPVSIGRTATLTCPTPLPEPEAALLSAIAIATLAARSRLRSQRRTREL